MIRPAHSRFKGSRWNLWKHGVTQGFLRRFRACREQTRLRYCEGWGGVYTSFALEFGTCGHWVLSEVYTRRTQDVELLLKEYIHRWRREHPLCTQKTLATQEEVYACILPVLRGYLKKWKKDWSKVDPEGKHWLATEQEFCVPFVYEDGQKVWVRGVFDGVFEDKASQLWLFETKCKGRILPEELADLIPCDLQVQLYLWALGKVYKRAPMGVLYNIIRIPGVRRAKCDSLSDLVGKVEANMQKESTYYLRPRVPVSRPEREHWLNRTMTPLMNEVRMWWEGRLPHSMNEEALFTKYGKSDLTGLMLHGDEQGLVRRPTPYSELKMPDLQKK